MTFVIIRLKPWNPQPHPPAITLFPEPISIVNFVKGFGLSQTKSSSWRGCRNPTFEAQSPCLPPGVDGSLHDDRLRLGVVVEEEETGDRAEEEDTGEDEEQEVAGPTGSLGAELRLVKGDGTD